MKLDAENFTSLAAKLDGLELSEHEHAALAVLLGADAVADGNEVSGFAGRIYVGNLPVRGFNIAMPTTFEVSPATERQLFPSRNVVINHEEQ